MAISRLIVCFDGTWNTPDSGSNPTNVVKILRAIRDDGGDARQVTFYDKGVGTGGVCDKVTGGAFGAGLTANMIDGYRFLANNWQSGDEIYIFGFSRGAYTARSLAGFLGLCGMISPLYLGWGLQSAIDIYRKPELSPDQKQSAIDALNIDRERSARIRCIGVWDTVGALGIPGDLGRNFLSKDMYFHNVQLSGKVDVALHAVAIDEKRDEFSPTLWVNDTGSVPANQVVEQVWFSGVHSNVGGSYRDAGLSDIALDWMIKRVRHHTSLAFDDAYINEYVKPDATGKGVESRSTLYLTSKAYPYQRLIKQVIPKGKGFGEWYRETFKKFDRRSILPEGLKTLNEMLHVSALERWRVPVVCDCPEDKQCKPSDYRPVNLAEAIRKQLDGSITLPVVGWDGNVLADNQAPWPRVD